MSLPPTDSNGSARKPRFVTAMACYVVLALLSTFTLDRIPCTIVLLLLAGFAVKTWIAAKRQS